MAPQIIASAVQIRESEFREPIENHLLGKLDMETFHQRLCELEEAQRREQEEAKAWRTMIENRLERLESSTGVRESPTKIENRSQPDSASGRVTEQTRKRDRAEPQTEGHRAEQRPRQKPCQKRFPVNKRKSAEHEDVTRHVSRQETEKTSLVGRLQNLENQNT